MAFADERVVVFQDVFGAADIARLTFNFQVVVNQLRMDAESGLEQTDIFIASAEQALYTSGNTFGAFDSSGRLGEGVLLLTKPYRKAELARMVRLCLDRAIDHMGDPIPLPYSVQEDLERFLRENPPKPG